MNWASLTPVEHVYWIIACGATVVLIVQTIIAFISGVDIHTGSDIGAHHDIGGAHFQLLTIRNIVAFFTIMGWSGLAFNSFHFSLGLTICLSIFCGFLMMMATAVLFYILSKLQSEGTIQITQAKDEKAKVYLTIPPSRSGEGKIQVVMQGRIVEFNAITDDLLRIETGAMVEVVEILQQSQALVKRI